MHACQLRHHQTHFCHSTRTRFGQLSNRLTPRKLPTSSRKVPQTVAGAPIRAECAAAIGRYAYIWGWELVNMHNRHATFARAPHPGLCGGVVPIGAGEEKSSLTKPPSQVEWPSTL